MKLGTTAFRLWSSGRASRYIYSPPVSSVDSAEAILLLFQRYSIVELVYNGVYLSAQSFAVPAGRRLFGSGATIQQRTTSTNTNVINVKGVVEDLIIDGNMAAREAAGYSQYCHGALMRDAYKAAVRRCTIKDCGDAINQGFTGLAAVGIYVDRDETALVNASGCIAEHNIVLDTAYRLPFGMRNASSFTGFAEGEQGHVNTGTQFLDNEIHGTFKNVLEVVGPDTKNWLVARNKAYRPLGQGGFEGDFGANNGEFLENEIHEIGVGTPLVKTHSAFNARTSDKGDGKLKQSRDIKMTRNKVIGGEIHNGFHIYAREDAGALRTIWTEHTMTGMSVVAGAGRIVGHSLDTTVFAVSGMRDNNPNIQGATHAMQMYGSLGCNDCQWSGGSFDASAYGFWNSSSAPITTTKLTGGIHLTAPIVVDSKGPLTVDNAVLSGTSIVVPTTPSDLSIVNSSVTLPTAAMTALTTAIPAVANPANHNTLIAV